MKKIQLSELRPFFKAVILFVSLAMTSSCSSPQNEETDSVALTPLVDQFVKLKYDGAYRTDTLFAKTMRTHFSKATESNDKKGANEILLLETEWQLLKEDQAKVTQLLAEVHTSPASGMHRWLKAFSLANDGMRDSAKQTIAKILDEKSVPSALQLKANWLMGAIYEEEKRDSLAIHHYAKAVETGPVKNEVDYYLESLFHMGNIRYTGGDIAQAEKDYDSALEKAIQYEVHRLVPFGYYHTGKVQEKKDKKAIALAQYAKGRAYLVDRNQPGHFLIPLLEKKMGELEESVGR